MRIVYCLHGTYNSGGMERIVVSKANWLVSHGHEVAIVTTEQASRPDFFPMNEKVSRVDLDIRYQEIEHLSRIARFFHRKRREKLHRKKMTSFLFGFRPDITISTSTFGRDMIFLPSIKDGSKKIAEIHFSRYSRLYIKRKGLWGIIDKIKISRDKKYASRYDKFICLTQEDLANWSDLTNVEAIPNFVTITPPDLSADLSQKSMIAAGRLGYQKGFERLIAAWHIVYERFPSWKLNIYGGGELRSVLQHEINTRHLESVITIHKPEANIVPRYLENSVCILSSRYEGWGLVLTEAMACGLPIVSFTCPCGPRDLIQDGYNGLLVPDGNIEGLANAIIRLIEDKELRAAMGRNAIEESKKYLIDNVMARWEKLFRQLLSR